MDNMMSSWKKVKRSGTFRRKVQKERDEMLKRALEVAEELKKKGNKMISVGAQQNQFYFGQR